jgi:hypothetical protein
MSTYGFLRIRCRTLTRAEPAVRPQDARVYTPSHPHRSSTNYSRGFIPQGTSCNEHHCTPLLHPPGLSQGKRVVPTLPSPCWLHFSTHPQQVQPPVRQQNQAKLLREFGGGGVLEDRQRSNSSLPGKVTTVLELFHPCVPHMILVFRYGACGQTYSEHIICLFHNLLNS